MSNDQHARTKLNDLKARVERLEAFAGAILQKPVHKTTDMTFGEALEAMKRGKKVGRWHREDIYVYFQPRDGGMLEELRVKTIQGLFAPWTANHAELLAEDWRIIGDEE